MLTQKPPQDPIPPADKDLLWRFRFYLTQNKKALPKFLRCVDWADAVEVKQAIELLDSWVPMDVEDALELLSAAYVWPSG